MFQLLAPELSKCTEFPYPQKISLLLRLYRNLFSGFLESQLHTMAYKIVVDVYHRQWKAFLLECFGIFFLLFRFFLFSSLPFPPFLRLFPFPPFFLLFFLDLHKVRRVPLRIQKLVRYARVELERLDALERSEAHLLGAPTPQLAHLRMGARTITTLLSVDFQKKGLDERLAKQFVIQNPVGAPVGAHDGW